MQICSLLEQTILLENFKVAVDASNTVSVEALLFASGCMYKTENNIYKFKMNKEQKRLTLKETHSLRVL